MTFEEDENQVKKLEAIIKRDIWPTFKTTRRAADRVYTDMYLGNNQTLVAVVSGDGNAIRVLHLIIAAHKQGEEDNC